MLQYGVAWKWLRHSGWPAADNLWRHEDLICCQLDVPYVSGAGDDQRVDLVLPRDGVGPCPTVVFVHGGAHKRQGRRFWRPVSGLYTNVGAALAQHGIATVVVGYRQPPAGDGDTALFDIGACLDWIAADAHERLDSERLVLAGHSAGAHLALLTALRGASVRGAVAMAGYYDVERMAARMGKSGQALRALFAEPHARYACAPLLAATSLEILVLVGERDPVSLRAEYDALKAAPNATRARFETVAGATHMGLIMQMGRHRDSVTGTIARFVQRVCT